MTDSEQIGSGLTDAIISLKQKFKEKITTSSCQQDFDSLSSQLHSKMFTLYFILKDLRDTSNENRFPVGDQNDPKFGVLYKKIDVLFETFNFIITFMNIEFVLKLPKQNNKTDEIIESKIKINNPTNTVCSPFLTPAAYAHLLYGNETQIPKETYRAYVTNPLFKQQVDDALNHLKTNNYKKMVDIFYLIPTSDDIGMMVPGSSKPHKEVVATLSLKGFIERHIKSTDVMIEKFKKFKVTSDFWKQ